MNATASTGLNLRSPVFPVQSAFYDRHIRKLSSIEANQLTPIPAASLPEDNTIELPFAGSTPAGTEAKKANDASAQEEMAKRIREAVKEFEEKLTSLQFRIDEESHTIIVQVVNKASGEVIRQIPPEELLHLSRRLKDMRGVLFDRQS